MTWGNPSVSTPNVLLPKKRVRHDLNRLNTQITIATISAPATVITIAVVIAFSCAVVGAMWRGYWRMGGG